MMMMVIIIFFFFLPLDFLLEELLSYQRVNQSRFSRAWSLPFSVRFAFKNKNNLLKQIRFDCEILWHAYLMWAMIK